ncbi:hypothetical protein PTKIN_Ptkin02bG0036200 [Pterospermum kingtungense]
MASQDSNINIAMLTEENWCNRMNKLIECDLENEMPITIFRVPNSLVAIKPEAYSPQVIALGPYHHLQPELHELDRYKVAAAKKTNKHFQLAGLQQLVEEIENKQVPSIRACYRGHLALQKKTLALIMVVDSLFLLGLLKTLEENGQNCHSKSLAPSFLVDCSGKKLPRDAILKDVLMLENQIPFFVLNEILAKTSSNTTTSSSEDMLASMLVKFREEFCPIKLMSWSNSSSEVVKHHHLLDLLYQSITFDPDNCGDSQAKSSFNRTHDSESSTVPLNPNIFSKLWGIIPSINVGCMTVIKRVTDTFIAILEVFGTSSLAFLNEKKVLIHSVSKLCSAGVKFCAAKGGTRFVRFDVKSLEFYLPVIVLKPTSEVVMRNLVAYETMAKSESLNFKRYTELMSAIVDTNEDVELLKQAEVIDSKLSADEIVEIFNGMTKSMESKDMVIDEAIKEVNKYYNNTKKAKAYRLMKKYIYSSWKILTVFASLLLLLLMGMQTFCDVYSCPSLLSKTKAA